MIKSRAVATEICKSEIKFKMVRTVNKCTQNQNEQAFLLIIRVGGER